MRRGPVSCAHTECTYPLDPVASWIPSPQSRRHQQPRRVDRAIPGYPPLRLGQVLHLVVVPERDQVDAQVEAPLLPRARGVHSRSTGVYRPPPPSTSPHTPSHRLYTTGGIINQHPNYIPMAGRSEERWQTVGGPRLRMPGAAGGGRQVWVTTTRVHWCRRQGQLHEVCRRRLV